MSEFATTIAGVPTPTEETVHVRNPAVFVEAPECTWAQEERQ
jgi:hypothetical protein